jgi:hypothetical protein
LYMNSTDLDLIYTKKYLILIFEYLLLNLL